MSKKHNDIKTFAIIILITLGCIWLVKHFHIKNFHVVQPAVLYTSGQPRGMDYTRLLYKYNIATIVNLREADEHREDHWYHEEITWTRENGVKYVELSFPKRPQYYPPVNIQSKFLSLITDDENRPILIHDSAGKKRVSMLAAVYLAKVKNMPPEKIFKIIKKIKESLNQQDKEYIKKLTK
jgi:protein tyrosine/serine phosphatase